MNRAVIVCGAKISDYEWVSSYFREDDYFIYCDSGLVHEDRFLSPYDFSANLIVGDFDSHKRPDRDALGTEIIQLPKEKDDTDSVYAVKEAVKRGAKAILLVGVIGQRLDHSLVNVYILQYLYEHDIKALIVDDYSEMCLVGPSDVGRVDDTWEFFSLVAISGNASGVTIKNAKYILDNADITSSYQFATSNEPIHGLVSEIFVSKGYLLLIKCR